MFIGIDHGTTAMRFASASGRFKITRESATSFQITDLSRLCPPDEIEGIALTYSMGDNFSKITPIRKLRNRGLVSREGAGKHIGGGTRVFDEVRRSGIPTVVIPGLHAGSPTDPRFKVYSHQSSPEKIGIAYEVCHDLGSDVIISDTSSNTVSLLISTGHIAGAFDACIFAPGTRHGALDVDAIRRIDAGELTANEAFQTAGVDFALPKKERIRTVAMFSAMECAALLLLNRRAKIALAGSLAPVIAAEVRSLLKKDVAVYDEWCAARGLARIAEDVFSGTRQILGLAVDL
ncbi:MAG TPA: methanogenesis marker 12 protein [Methanoregulaceae archaeon]|nr:methanogenesis marker 12 protein [Methanoregulaceae archaeon]HPD74682.1 methanogenesis marker 12 protein [Methanoregulaceae archaeon]HRY75168.1 methanogenesis marker 12 protein [Methanoregulaceae archaeon]